MISQKIDKQIKTLVDAGRKKGYLTYDDIHDLIPDDVASPDNLDGILMMLDEQGIELRDEDPEAEFAAGGSEGVDDKSGSAAKETPQEDVRERNRMDDPVRMYLTQMGQIPLLTREQEIALAKRIETADIFAHAMFTIKFENRFIHIDHAPFRVTPASGFVAAPPGVRSDITNHCLRLKFADQ